MIKIEKTEVYGWEAAIRGARNPMNSWSRSDSKWEVMNKDDVELGHAPDYEYIIGENDLDLMRRLVKAGTDHSKFMRMINVTCDITAPLYFWKQASTYKVGTVENSCSTMHKIHNKEFALDDFSYEDMSESGIYMLNIVINDLNSARFNYNSSHDKIFWNDMIKLLPSSYNQKRTWQGNYAVLRNMYHSRKNHKLQEWHDFCDWVETLPYSELITIEKDK